jgi:hypothetical protein
MIINLSDIYVFEMPELHYFEHTCDIRHLALKESVKSQESVLIKAKADFKQQLQDDEGLKGLDERDKGSYYDQIYSYEEETIRDLEQLQRNATCQIIFSSFEGQLTTLCEIVEKYINVKTPLRNVKSDSDIIRYWKFLNESVVGITDKNIRLLKGIIQRKKVRNKITHKGGLVNQDKVDQYLTHKGLRATKQGEKYKLLIAHSDYLVELINDVKEFFSELLVAIDQTYQSQKD